MAYCFKIQCEYSVLFQNPIMNITFYTSNNSLDDLQDFLNERLSPEYLICGRKNRSAPLPCNGKKTITTTVSPINLMIEVLKWADKSKMLYVLDFKKPYLTYPYF